MSNPGPISDHHIFVINNPTNFVKELLIDWGAEINTPDWSISTYPINNRVKVTCIAFQLERGENEDTPHIQGYMQTNLKTSTYKLTDKLQEYFRVRPHVEECKGSSESNLEYVSKEDTRIESAFGPHVFGTPALYTLRVARDIAMTWQLYNKP